MYRHWANCPRQEKNGPYRSLKMSKHTSRFGKSDELLGHLLHSGVVLYSGSPTHEETLPSTVTAELGLECSFLYFSKHLR